MKEDASHIKFRKPKVVGVQVISCEDWRLKNCVVKEGSIMNQIYEYAKQLEARINVMKSCSSCKNNTWQTTLVCRWVFSNI